MKIITTIHEINNLANLLSLSDGIILGNNNFSARQTNSFSINEINLIINETKLNKKEVFLNLNKMYYDEEMELLKEFLLQIKVDKLDGIVIADIGLLHLLEQLNLKHLAIYNPETLHTNYFDFNYLSDDNILGSFVAKEITIEDILLIGKNKKYKLFYTGHGNLNMFYSKRNLLTNFTDHLEVEWELKNNKNLLIMEKKRKDERYPLLEDESGTHVFRANTLSSINFLNDLEKVCDYLIIDTIFKDDNYAKEVIPLYKDKSINKENYETIKDKLEKQYNEKWDDGFLNHKTFYKVKKNERQEDSEV